MEKAKAMVYNKTSPIEMEGVHVMKQIAALLLAAVIALSFCACGKDTAAPENTGDPVAEDTPPESVMEVKITLDNLYDYFEYREYTSYFKNDSGEINYVQISYGLALKEGYTAADSTAYRNTMTLTFTADGIVNSGSYDVDYTTLQFSGTTRSTETRSIEQTLSFWPRGDRTTVWTYGCYSDSYVIYLENFRVVSAGGSIYLQSAQS